MKILTRYVLKEHAGPLVYALVALTSLLLLNQIAKRFGDLIGKGLSWGIIAEFFLLSVPFIVAMTLPMAVLVATLYAFSRLAAENEITALKATGIGLGRLLVPVLLAATVLAALMVAFNDQLLPRSNHRLRTLQADIARKKPTFALREQVINEVSPGRLFLKAGHVDQASNMLSEVTIYDMSDPLRRRTIYADSGQMAMSRDRSDLQLTLFDGHSLEASRDNPGELQRLSFDVDLVRVRGVANQLERTEDDSYKSDREMSICEMQQTVRDGEEQFAKTRSELAATLAAAARRAATGEARTAPEPAPRVERRDLAEVYCGWLLPLLGVTQAQETPPDSEPSLAPERDMMDAEEGIEVPVTRDLSRDRSAGSALAAIRRQPARAPSALVAEIEMLRSRMIDARERVSRFDVEIQKKFALSVACVVFVLLGAPIALRFPRGGVGLVLGVSLVVFALYYVGLIAGETLADKLILPPFWAMWMANALFTVVGIVLLIRVRKAGATARGGDLRELWEAVRGWFVQPPARVRVPARRMRRAA